MRSEMPAPSDMGYGTWVSDPPRDLAAYCHTYRHEYFGEIEVGFDEGTEASRPRRLMLFLGPKKRKIALHRWSGDTFVYEIFGENAVGLSAVEFDMTMPGKPRACVKNLQFCATDPGYSEIDPEVREPAWFSS